MTAPIKPENQQELIPKAELETLKTTYEQSIADLQKKVSEAQSAILAPDYLEYLDAKKSLNKGQKVEGNDEVKELRKQLADTRAALAEVAAAQELETVIKAHPDFNDVRKDVQKILEESKTELTIEQAYLIAKAQKPPAEKKPEEKKPEFGNEKPSGVYPVEGDSSKKFKNENDAAQAAANEVLAKYGINGGVI